jgi:DNA (cytosine-5)-methyltransferase 1
MSRMLGRWKISERLRIGSLCTGYGGLDMAVEAYFNAKTSWVSEIDKFACKVIDARINKPNLGNLKVINWATVEPIDILTAGYPCQPFSHAGLRKGANDERHLWPYIKEAIGRIRPSLVFLENVRGHFGLGFRDVLTDLTSIGYDVRWTLIRASDVGAPHRRERLFIFAYSNGARRNDSGTKLPNGLKQSCENVNSANTDSERQKRQTKKQELERERFSKPGQNIKHTNTDGERQPLGEYRGTASRNTRKSQFEPSRVGEAIYTQDVPPPLDKGKLNVKFVEYMMGLPPGWVTDIDISRANQLKILGNGVVPQQAYRALELLCNIDSYPQGRKTCGQHAQSPFNLSTLLQSP